MTPTECPKSQLTAEDTRMRRAPYDLAEHFDAHGGVLHDGETMESKRVMGVRENARQRRVCLLYTSPSPRD